MSFSGERLRVLRTFNGLKQSALGDLVAVSAAAISQYEHNRREPDEEITLALCDELGVRPSYFEAGILDEITEDGTNFRSQRTTPKRDRQRVLAYGTLLAEWVTYLSRYIRLPDFDVPAIPVQSTDDIEQAAERCREHWSLGFGPIRQITRVLENAGIVVTVMNNESTKIDAFSSFSTKLNIVALSTAKGSSSRAMFDCMHEVGHAVLHRADEPGSDMDQREFEANWFAGAFLLPRQTFAREFWSTGGSTLRHLFELKIRWGVSVQAMVYRARQLNLVTTSQYRRWMKDVSRRGWRSGVQEPEEPEPPRPELLAQAFSRFKEKTGKGVSKAATDLGWGHKLFRQITGIEDSAVGAELHSLAEYRSRRA